MKSSDFYTRLGVSLVAGILFCTGFEPFNLWPISFCSIAAFFVLMRDTEVLSSRFFIAWVFGIGKYMAGASWIFVSIHEHGNANWFISGLLVLGFTSIFALSFGVFGIVFHVLVRKRMVNIKFHKTQMVLAFAFAWLLYEWLISWLFGGFPWLLAGYVTTHTWIYGLAAIGGVSLNSLVVVLTSCVALYLRRITHGILLFSILGGLTLLSFIPWVQTGDSIRVGVAQLSMDIRDKWGDRYHVQGIFKQFFELSKTLDADLVVWPESAIVADVEYMSRLFEERSHEISRTSFLVGGFDIDSSSSDREAYNSLILFSNTTPIVYRKQILVPFGEYIPFREALGPVFDFFRFPASDLKEGLPQQPLMELRQAKLFPTICFEIIFSDFINAENNRRRGDILVNVSEDAWFGNSIGPHQHFQVARMRAVEQGRYLLRAANRGISALVDPNGKVVERLSRLEANSFAASAHRMIGRTPFSYIPISSALLFSVILLVCFLIFNRFKTA